jgi:hypothetical protein
MLGSTDEIVYTDSVSSSMGSELVWPIPPSLGVALDMRILWAPWLETSFRVLEATELLV